jgi:hypothetical protein
MQDIIAIVEKLIEQGGRFVGIPSFNPDISQGDKKWGR